VRAFSLLSLLNQMPMSSGKTQMDTPKSNVLPATRASPSLVKWTHRIDHYKMYGCMHTYYICVCTYICIYNVTKLGPYFIYLFYFLQ
jgi:hypothetical protein